MLFNEEYYNNNRQDSDRIGLLFYSNLIKNYFKPNTILDYGCGSGILSIAAIKIGAKKVIGVDINDQAIKTSQENAEINNVKIFWSYTSNIIKYKADLVVANILSSALSVLAPVLAEHCNTKGKIALSGILQSQEEAIKKKYSKCASGYKNS